MYVGKEKSSLFQNDLEQIETCDNYGLREQTNSNGSFEEKPSYLSGYFQTKLSDPETKFEATLEKNVLTLALKKNKKILPLTFWTKLHMVRSRDKKIIGFKIYEKDNSYCFYSEDQNKIDEWKKELCKYTIVWGFYQDYKPIEKIGKGRTAAVFLALRRKDNEKVAIKAFFKNEIKAEPKSIEGLQNQIKILRSVSCPYLLKYLAAYETQKSYYLVTQYVQGRTLTSLIEQRPLAYQQSKKILKQLSLGLKYLEKKDIAHRDLKPDNIIINERTLKPCIVDFGLATICTNVEYIYKHCGTPGYVAPQILHGVRKDITPGVDMFSLGIIFHLMLFRRFPYSARDIQLILKQNKNADFNFKSMEYSTVPEEGIKLMEDMLNPSPTSRITPRQVIKNLDSKNQLWDLLVSRAPAKMQSPEYRVKWDRIYHNRMHAIRSDSFECSKHKSVKRTLEL